MNAISKEETILFARQLALAIRSDLPLTGSLELIGEKTDNSDLKKVLKDMVDDLNMGQMFADVISKHEEFLTPFMVQMVKIGEESGNLPEVLEQVAQTYEKQLESGNKLRAAVTYPIILTGLMFGVIILLIAQVMPMFNDVLKSLGGEIPGFTRGILSVSLFLRDNGLIILIVLAIIVIGLIVYSKTEAGVAGLDRLKFKLPVYAGINSSLLATRFARNLGTLIKSGLSYQQGLELIKPTMNNKHAEDMIAQGIDGLNQGESLESVMDKMNLFPPLLMKIFGVAEKAGQMDRALLTAADEMEKELDYRIGRLTNVVEPVLIIILSLIVGFILVSVVLPVVNIMNSIG